ncbi:MAG: NIPSNAP family protein [Pseudomonas sp.]|nr:NIPSNAP family protein [Pseudomonas sp.]
MIDELREYRFTPHAWEQYWELFVNLCLPIRQDNYGVLQGVWLETEAGSVTFRHLWRYESLDERARLRGELLKVDTWRKHFLPQAAPLVSQQQLHVLNPHRALGEATARYLHTYWCPTGQAQNAIAQIDAVIEQGRHGACGVWATEFSDPNQVWVLGTQAAAPQVDLQVPFAIHTRTLVPLSTTVAPNLAENRKAVFF